MDANVLDYGGLGFALFMLAGMFFGGREIVKRLLDTYRDRQLAEVENQSTQDKAEQTRREKHDAWMQVLVEADRAERQTREQAMQDMSASMVSLIQKGVEADVQVAEQIRLLNNAFSDHEAGSERRQKEILKVLR